MVASVPVKNFLQNRRERAVGSILGTIEATFKRKLDDREWQHIRRVVIDSMNSYHDSVLDLLKAEDGVIRNDVVVELLERLDRQLVAMERTTAAS